VTAAAVLPGYAGCAGALGARVLARVRWTAPASLLGILTYLADAVAVRTALTAAGHQRAAGRHARRHVRTARLAGRLQPGLGAVVTRPPQPLRPLRQYLPRATAATLALTPVPVALTPAIAALALGQAPAA
jgi:hypothetical protein